MMLVLTPDSWDNESMSLIMQPGILPLCDDFRGK
jgi:hypothetical protein